MGYDFALDDKWRLGELDRLQSPLYSHKHHPMKSSLSETKLQELKEKALSMVKERYELTNSRRKEMDLDPLDVDELLQNFQNAYIGD